MKSFLVVLLSFVFVNIIFGQETSSGLSTTSMHIMSNGIGIGSAIAVVASWSRNKSVIWAIIHAIFGWIYVIYFALTGGADKG